MVADLVDADVVIVLVLGLHSFLPRALTGSGKKQVPILAGSGSVHAMWWPTIAAIQ